MGYACPVCETPQADAEHLANHLAFTAILGDGDHERWLDEHTPGWEEAGEAELADRAVEYADEPEFPQVFEDTTHHTRDRDGPRPGELFDDDADFQRWGRNEHPGFDGHSRESDDPAVEQAIAEARELMRGQDEDDEASDAGADEPDDGDETQ